MLWLNTYGRLDRLNDVGVIPEAGDCSRPHAAPIQTVHSGYADRVPVAMERHDSLTVLPWNSLAGGALLGVVRGHRDIENNRLRRLDMEWHEDLAGGASGAATDVLGLPWLWASILPA